MIEDDFYISTSKTQYLKPEDKESIESGNLLTAESKAGIEAGDLLSAETKTNIDTGALLPVKNSQTISTGDLLSAEVKADIDTGDLLSAESKETIDTGDLLTAKSSQLISTGDLLSAESKSDITTGGVLTPKPLPSNSDLPLNYPRIGYDNTLVNGSSSASSDNLGSANLLTPSTYDKWRPTVAATALLTGTSKTCDYVGIAAHNLGTQGATLTVRVSNDGVSFTTVYNQLVPNNNALFIRFTAATYKIVELSFTGGTAIEIGAVYLGKELEVMRPIFAGHKPANLSSTDVMTPQISGGGQFLGKQIVRQGFTTSVDLQHLTDEWYRTEFQSFVDHAKTGCYFWAWNLLESPNDIVYGWTNNNITPSYMGIRNWLEVSFNIEAHA